MRAARRGFRSAPARRGETMRSGRGANYACSIQRLRIGRGRRVRNDDSVVLEGVYGDVAMLLTGDISADIERARRASTHSGPHSRPQSCASR
jgi:hypothetical protein